MMWTPSSIDPRRAVPLREDEHVACAQHVDGLLQLRAVLDVLAGGLLAEDLIAMLCAQRRDLTVEVLMRG